jgi:hypothetical protein
LSTATADEEPVRGIARRDAQRDAERILLRLCERLEPVEERRAQLMDPANGELHLRLDAFDLDGPQAGACRAACRSSAVLPMPGSPRITRTAL